MSKRKLQFAQDSELLAAAERAFGAENAVDSDELSSSSLESSFSASGSESESDFSGKSDVLSDKDDGEASGSDGEDETESKRRRVAQIAQREEARARARHRRKNRVLVVSSTGVGARFRHLMNDISLLLPHSKRDAKVDVKKNLQELNELAEMNSCEKCLFFQMKSKRDMYMWASRCPSGPSVLFQVLNIHTMAELKLTGNCLLGSRPVLLFDAAFDDPALPHLKIVKELFQDIWSTPEGHPKSKPFVDHVISFFWQDDHIWFRNYQLIENVEGTSKGAKNSAATTQLAEIGPRFVLEPIRIFSQSFGGPTLWKNTDFVTPAKVRQAERKQAGMKYNDRFAAQRATQTRNADRHRGFTLPGEELAGAFRR